MSKVTNKRHTNEEGAKEIVKSLISILLIVLTIRTFVFESYKIPSGSMYPTNYVGDFLFVSKFKYGITHFSFPFSPKLFSGRLFGQEPKRGEVAVFRLPKDTSIDYIKRVIGLPKDRIQVKHGILHINGAPVKLERIEDFEIEDGGVVKKVSQYMETLPNGVTHKILKHEPLGMGRVDNTVEYTVPEGHYFMMGDNRDRSLDSRFLSDVGFVPLENFIGRAELTYFSIDRAVADAWELWKWPWAVRFGRIITLIR